MEEWVFTDGTGGLHRRPMPAHLRRRPAAYQAAVPIFDPYAPGPGPFAGPGGTVAPGQREPWGDAPTPGARSFTYQATGFDDAWGRPPDVFALAWNPIRRLYEPVRKFGVDVGQRASQEQLYAEYARLAREGVFVQAYQDEAAPGTWRFRWVRVRTPWPSLEQPYQVLGDYGERFLPAAQRAIEVARQRRFEAEAALKAGQTARQLGEGPAAARNLPLDRVLMLGPAHAKRAPAKPRALSDYAWIAQQALPKGCPYPYPYMPVPQQDYATGAWLSPDYTPSIPLPPPFDLIPWRCSVPAAPGEYKGKGQPPGPKSPPTQVGGPPAGAPGGPGAVTTPRPWDGGLGFAADFAGAGRVARGAGVGGEEGGAPEEPPEPDRPPGEPAPPPAPPPAAPPKPARETSYDEETEDAIKDDPDVERVGREAEKVDKEIEKLYKRRDRAKTPEEAQALREMIVAAEARYDEVAERYFHARDSAAARFNKQRMRDLERERRKLENKKRTTWSPERKAKIDAEIAAVNNRIDWAQYYVARVAVQRLTAEGVFVPPLTNWAPAPGGVDSDPAVRARLDAQRKAALEVLALLQRVQAAPEDSYQRAALQNQLLTARYALEAASRALTDARAAAVRARREPTQSQLVDASIAAWEREIRRLKAERSITWNAKKRTELTQRIEEVESKLAHLLTYGSRGTLAKAANRGGGAPPGLGGPNVGGGGADLLDEGPLEPDAMDGGGVQDGGPGAGGPPGPGMPPLVLPNGRIVPPNVPAKIAAEIHRGEWELFERRGALSSEEQAARLEALHGLYLRVAGLKVAAGANRASADFGVDQTQDVSCRLDALGVGWHRRHPSAAPTVLPPLASPEEQSAPGAQHVPFRNGSGRRALPPAELTDCDRGREKSWSEAVGGLEPPYEFPIEVGTDGIVYLQDGPNVYAFTKESSAQLIAAGAGPGRYTDLKRDLPALAHPGLLRLTCIDTISSEDQFFLLVLLQSAIKSAVPGPVLAALQQMGKDVAATVEDVAEAVGDAVVAAIEFVGGAKLEIITTLLSGRLPTEEQWLALGIELLGDLALGPLGGKLVSKAFGPGKAAAKQLKDTMLSQAERVASRTGQRVSPDAVRAIENAAEAMSEAATRRGAGAATHGGERAFAQAYESQLTREAAERLEAEAARRVRSARAGGASPPGRLPADVPGGAGAGGPPAGGAGRGAGGGGSPNRGLEPTTSKRPDTSPVGEPRTPAQGADGPGQSPGTRSAPRPRLIPWTKLSPSDAEDWLVKRGVDPDKARSFVRAMDEPIEVGILPKGTRVDAWVGDPKAPGNWVGNPGISRDAAAVDALDHLNRPRVRAHYEITDDVAVLRSTAKPQSGEAGSWIKGTGGGTQYTSPDLSRHLRLVR